MRGGVCVIAELVPASVMATDSFTLLNQIYNCKERFISASQFIETRRYTLESFSAAVKTYGSTLESWLLARAHLVAPNGGNFCNTWGNGGVITTVKTAEGKWFVTHPLDEDKLFDRHCSFLPVAAQQMAPRGTEGLQKRPKK